MGLAARESFSLLFLAAPLPGEVAFSHILWKGESLKAEVLNAFFISVFTSTARPLSFGTKIRVEANVDPLSVKKELVCELLQELNPYKLMGPDIIHLRVFTRAG